MHINEEIKVTPLADKRTDTSGNWGQDTELQKKTTLVPQEMNESKNTTPKSAISLHTVSKRPSRQFLGTHVPTILQYS